MSNYHASVINYMFNKYNLVDPLYLEIGVWSGSTFKNVNSINKDGVDTEQYCSSPYVNYKMSSDTFFERHITKKYDFIFIDGLHTAFQVTKDIYNSIKNLNNGGIIMIDDIYPHSKYEQEALDLRKVGPNTGDVWKAIYNIIDTLEKISQEIFFIKDNGRGNLVCKIKPNNDINIYIDPSIPTKNTDGRYTGNDKEWNKYEYDTDFIKYESRLMKYYKKI